MKHFSSSDSSSSFSAGLSRQQVLLKRANSSNPLGVYRSLSFGNGSTTKFILYELHQLLGVNLGGILGLGLRRILLKRFLAKSGSGLICGRGVTLRHPRRIFLGENVFLDENSVLDLRMHSEQSDARIELADSVVVGRGTILVAKDGKIELGRGVNISSNCRIATTSTIVIGESTLIAAYCYIGPGNHRTDKSQGLMIESEMDDRGGVKIGSNVWIGAHSTVLDGVEIGNDAVIGAHSLVRENVASGTVVAGVPARVIRRANSAN